MSISMKIGENCKYFLINFQNMSNLPSIPDSAHLISTFPNGVIHVLLLEIFLITYSLLNFSFIFTFNKKFIINIERSELQH